MSRVNDLTLPIACDCGTSSFAHGDAQRARLLPVNGAACDESIRSRSTRRSFERSDAPFDSSLTSSGRYRDNHASGEGHHSTRSSYACPKPVAGLLPRWPAPATWSRHGGHRRSGATASGLARCRHSSARTIGFGQGPRDRGLTTPNPWVPWLLGPATFAEVNGIGASPDLPSRLRVGGPHARTAAATLFEVAPRRTRRYIALLLGASIETPLRRGDGRSTAHQMDKFPVALAAEGTRCTYPGAPPSSDHAIVRHGCAHRSDRHTCLARCGTRSQIEALLTPADARIVTVVCNCARRSRRSYALTLGQKLCYSEHSLVELRGPRRLQPYRSPLNVASLVHQHRLIDHHAVHRD